MKKTIFFLILLLIIVLCVFYDTIILEPFETNEENDIIDNMESDTNMQLNTQEYDAYQTYKTNRDSELQPIIEKIELLKVENERILELQDSFKLDNTKSENDILIQKNIQNTYELQQKNNNDKINTLLTEFLQ